jgi:MFS transporter, putative metabolite:H+ symporter
MPTPAEPESIAARLDRLPPTRVHGEATAIAGIGTFFDLFDIFLAGVLGTVLVEHFSLSRAALPLILASNFIGMFLGATCLGWCADRAGRRTMFLVNLGVYSFFTMLGAFSTSSAMLVAARFFAGIGLGAELLLVDAYLGELLPRAVRGRYTAWAYTLGFVGVPAAGFLARVLVPLTPLGIDGWRWMFIAGSTGAVVVWLLRSRLPESPRWLESVGRVAEAEAIVARFERQALHERGATAITLIGEGVERPTCARVGLADLGGPIFRGRMAMLCVLQVFQAFGYYGFGTLVPIVLAGKGYSVVTSLAFTSVTFIGYPVGSALSLPIVERVDRRWLLASAAALMSVFGLILGYSTSPATILVSGFLYTAASNLFSNAHHIFQVEIFPTSVRTTAAGLAYGLSRLSTAAMPFVLVPVLDRWGAGTMFACVALALWIVIADVALFAPRTTGRALERI